MLSAFSTFQSCGALNRTRTRHVPLTCGICRPAAYPATCQAARGSQVPCLVKQHVAPSTAAAAPCRRPRSSRSSVACSARNTNRHKNSDADVQVPTTLTDALQQAARFATPGSSCPPDALAKLKEMDDSLGGRFYLLSCGQYDESHPMAGRPAHALLQMLLVSIEADPTLASVYTLRGTPTKIQVGDEPQDMENPMLYLIAYQLGEDGWPNGVAYNSATSFERATTKKHLKKVLNSAWLTYEGFEVMSLHVFFKHNLQPLDVAVVPRELTPLLQRYFHDQLAAAGVEVMLQEDAVMRKMRIKKQREQLKKENQEQLAKEQQAKGLPPLPAPTRVRRSRKLT